MHVFFSYNPHNKQRLFLQTTVTGLSLQGRQTMFHVKQELRFPVALRRISDFE
jgi:hypothetical protein